MLDRLPDVVTGRRCPPQRGWRRWCRPLSGDGLRFAESYCALAPHRPDAVFASKGLDVIVDILRTVRHTAIPTPQAS